MFQMRFRQAVGTWLCDRLFRWIYTRALAPQVSLSGLQMHYPDEAQRLFSPFSSEHPYHTVVPARAALRRQVASRHIQIPPAALAVGFKTQDHGLFRPWYGLADRFRPSGKKGSSACQPVHIIEKPFHHQATYPSVLCSGPFKWNMGAENT